MLIAEGSDWFWWYGDDHSSDHDLEFDELFRRHVRNIYRALDLPIPEELFVTNITTQPAAAVIHGPTGFIQPVIDGEVTNYFEWLGAGCVDVEATSGAMHQVAERGPGIALVEFGFDLEHLYLRVDGTRPVTELLASGLAIGVRFIKPTGVRILVRGDRGGFDARVQMRSGPRGQGDWYAVDHPGLTAAAGRVLEMQIPFAGLGVKTLDPVAFFVLLTREGVELEHHPRHLPIEFDVPDHRFAARSWTA
jgi:hypothetical protein